MRTKSFLLAAVAAFGLIIAAPPTQAFAIEQVGCNGQANVVKVTANSGAALHCFANSGTTAVNIPNVYRVESGTNKTTINLESGGRYYSRTLEPRQYVNFATTVRLYEIRIW